MKTSKILSAVVLCSCLALPQRAGHAETPSLAFTGDPDQPATLPPGYDCSSGNQTDIPESECEALTSLYDWTSGYAWTTNSGWLDTSPATWSGVTISGGHVTRIFLGNNNLSGTLPAALGNLPQLQYLDLYWNSLTGSIPAELGNLSNLIRLDLSWNSLSEAIPSSLGNLSLLQQLYLGDNGLSGSLPSALGNLSNLTSLGLNHNSLTGRIPQSFGNLTSLTTIRLDNNQLTDGVPYAFAAIGADAGTCNLTVNSSLCMPNTAEYLALEPPICGLGLQDACIVLPIELVSFEGLPVPGGIRLMWQTASESGSVGFEIERQVGASWRYVDFVESAGGSARGQVYSYAVEGADLGVHRFRLKMLDLDGSFQYSQIVEVTVEMADRFLLEPAYPNPFNPSTNIRFAVAESAPVRVVLYDTHGRLLDILFEGVPEAGSMQTMQIDGSDLPSGMYLVRLEGPGYSASGRLVLLK